MNSEEMLTFYREFKRLPTVLDILLWQEAKASIAIDKQWPVTMTEGKVVEDE